MLYGRILDIQERFPFFNSRVLSVEDLVHWAERLGAEIRLDARARHPFAYIEDGKPIVTYNPGSLDALQIIVLGHELGHILLGHIELTPRQCTVQNLFMQKGWERDASVIGYLCLIPTPALVRMARNEILTASELFSELQPMFGDNEEIGVRICQERVEIFRRFLDVCGDECLKGEKCSNHPVSWGHQTAITSATMLSAYDEVPVVTAPFEVHPGDEYRFRKDASNVIRLRWKAPHPGGKFRLLMRNVSVAGITFGEASAAAIAFLSGKHRSLELVRDPGNPHDVNAVKVIAQWHGRSTGEIYSEQIGWLPRGIASRVAGERRRLYAVPAVLFRAEGNKNPGIRFDVWVQS